jgi:hypothetical protein
MTAASSPRLAFVFVLFAASVLSCAGAQTAPSRTEPPPPARATPAARPPPVLEAAVRACALVTSCAHPRDPSELREPPACVDRLLSVHTARSACLGVARSCADVDACLARPHPGAEAARLCAERRGVDEFCAGGSVVTCEGEPGILRCSPGDRCRETTLASGIVVRGCAAECPSLARAPASRCVSDAIVSCSPGMPAERLACPTGSRCVEERRSDGDVAAVCERRPCVPGRGRCVGSRLETCVLGEDGRGGLVESDCAASGLVCSSTGTRAACSAADDCSRAPARCEGEALRFCAAGASVLVHCERWGLGPCHEDGGVASCTPP